MINREIKKDRPSLSKEQIEKHKDFSGVLKQAQQIPLWKNKWFWGSTGVAVLAIIASIVLLQREPINNSEQQVNQGHYPSAAIDSSYQTAWVDNNGGTYHFKYGAELKIPADAFVCNGEQYKGKVQIRFKSYHDYADILANHIDMRYDTAGEARQLETGGMFDLYAFGERGEVVEIADGKSIIVEMPTQNDEDFNFYYYDTTIGEWVYQGKANTLIAEDNTKKEKQQISISGYQKEKLYAAREDCQKKIIDLRHHQPIKPTEKAETDFQFKLDIDLHAFPELESFDGLEMAFHPSVPNNKHKILKQTWSDMQLHVIEKGVLYELELKDGNKKERVKVVPIGESDLWNEKMKAYENWEAEIEYEKEKLAQIEAEIQKQKKEIIEAQRNNEEARIERLNPEKVKDTVQDLSSFVKIRASIDLLEEQQKVFVQNGQVKVVNPKLQAYNSLRRQYEVPRTGRFNCDRPVEYPEKQKVQAVFAYNDTLKFDQVVLIDEKKNTTFPYIMKEFHSFGYHPKHNNIIFAFDKNGEAYYFPPNKFEQIDKKTDQFLFKLEPCRKDISSAEKLRLFISEQWEYAALAI